jgi:hypothetical protein
MKEKGVLSFEEGTINIYAYARYESFSAKVAELTHPEGFITHYQLIPRAANPTFCRDKLQGKLSHFFNRLIFLPFCLV